VTNHYVTRTEVAELLAEWDRRIAAVERGLNRKRLVLGTTYGLCVAMLVLVLSKVGQ
jgi:hypothetical protein